MGYREIILGTPGLKTYHRLSGATSEASIGPDTATMTYTGTPPTVAGLIKDPNGAKSFNGTSQLGTFSTSSLGGGPVTLEFWFREITRIDWSTFAGHEAWPTSRMGVTRRAGEDNLITGWRDSVGGNDYGCAGPYLPLKPNFVVYTVNPTLTRGRLYVNGVLRDQQTHISALPAGSLPFGVGGNSSGASANAVVDEVATYNVEMDDATQRKHYKAGLASGVLSGRLLPV